MWKQADFNDVPSAPVLKLFGPVTGSCAPSKLTKVADTWAHSGACKPVLGIHSVAHDGFALVVGEDVPAGAFLGEWCGEYVIGKPQDLAAPLPVPDKERCVCLFAGKVGSKMRFARHCCSPNAELVPFWDAVEVAKQTFAVPRLAMQTLSSIPAGSDILCDFGA